MRRILAGLEGEAYSNGFGERWISVVARILEGALEVGDERLAERQVGTCALDDVIEPAPGEWDLLRSPHPRFGRGG
jgi:hypothetical protein